METSKNNPLNVPMAIVIAGLLIAGALFLRGGSGALSLPAEVRQPTVMQPPPMLGAITLRPIDATRDHIRGNPNANVVFVEFSDTECPFCKRFHVTMQQVMSEYGKSGKVAWVYRQYPIVGLHSKAPKESEATECAYELGGNGKFWEYLDQVFEKTNSNDSLDPAMLPRIATNIGLNETAFNDCLSSGRQKPRVDADYADGSGAGVNGTPHSILVLKDPISEGDRKTLLSLYQPYGDPRTGELPVAFSLDGLRVSVNGALPYQIIKSTIDTLLK
ncbi:MAG: thioredoxin domain-containing protein [bacterium]|nr:thioredoxin domain-containing protein [bacterium]